MSLHLDERQRAMLAEIGVPLWWPPEPAPAPGPDTPDATPRAAQPAITIRAAGADPERARAQNSSEISAANHSAGTTRGAGPAQHDPVKPVAEPRPGTVLAPPDGIADMDWQALSQAIAGCQACPMGLGRQAPVFVAPPTGLRCDWLVLGDPPDDVQERAGLPFVENAGKLLDNMLRAVATRRCLSHHEALGALQDKTSPEPTSSYSAYLSLVLKCRPARPTAPNPATLAACAHYLRREIALLQPRVILAMGRFAMQVLLSEDHPEGLKLPLGKLRGQVWHYQGVPVVVTYPPSYLLRTGQDKARAWADLCLAMEVVQAPLAPP